MVIMALSEFLVGQRNTNESVLCDIETRPETTGRLISLPVSCFILVCLRSKPAQPQLNISRP